MPGQDEVRAVQEGVTEGLLGGLPHEFSAYRGVLKFPNGSQIVAGHYQAEKDIDNYLGLEYDVIGIEEATTLRVCFESRKSVG